MYLYIIPLFFRVAMMLFIIVINTEDDGGIEFGLYGIQMIIYKFCIFIGSLVGFKMKKVQIGINIQRIS